MDTVSSFLLDAALRKEEVFENLDCNGVSFPVSKVWFISGIISPPDQW